MDVQSVAHWLLIAGFAAAPFASLTARRFWPRVSGVVLLICTLSAVGCLAYAIDRSTMPPFSWLYWGTVVLLGIGISLRAFARHKIRFALVSGVVFVCTNLGLHFFATDFAMACKRSMCAVKTGMTIEQVHSVVAHQFVHCRDYHVAVEGHVMITNYPDYIQFTLRPEYIYLPSGSMQVEFLNGRVRSAQVISLLQSPLEWWEVAGALALCAVCLWKLGQRREGIGIVERADIATVLQRLQDVRAQCYQPRSGEVVVFAKRTFIEVAVQKIRRLAYFTRSHEETDVEE